MSVWVGANIFVDLALSIDQHLPGYVDAYFGPRELSESAASKGKVPIHELIDTASDLARSIAGDRELDDLRREYLAGEVRAMQATLRMLAGETLGITEEVEALYGVVPEWVDEASFVEVHRLLEDLLPGDGTLAERVRRFEKETEVPAEVAAPIFKELAQELRARSLTRFSLPDGESCEFAFVRNKPWGNIYNFYLGDYSSRIEVNLDFPIRSYTIPDLVTHEAYPGHHTERAIKERRLFREGGHLEHSIVPLNTPSTALSEGIAEVSLEVITSPEERVDIYREALHKAGLTSVDPQRARDFFEARLTLVRNVMMNSILMLHSRGSSENDVLAYREYYALNSRVEAVKILEIIKDPLYRSYGFSYAVGRLVKRLIHKVEQPDQWFSRLLEEPVNPAQVLRWIEQ